MSKQSAKELKRVEREQQRQVRDFVLAAGRGDLPQVRKLVRAGVNPNANAAVSGFTPLIAAVEKGHRTTVKYLLSAGADVNKRVLNEYVVTHLHATALMVACLNADMPMIKLLLEAGADININAIKDQPPTAISYAATHGHLEVVKLLLNRGAILPSFVLAGPVVHGHVEVVNVLIKAGAVVDDLKDRLGKARSLTLLAVGSAFPERTEKQIMILRLLAAAGAELNLNYRGWQTPLICATWKANLEVVNCLIELDADINLPDAAGRTALHFAAERGHTEIAQALIRAGADIALKDKKHRTPLDVAKAEKSKGVIEVLTKAGAGLNFTRQP
jgi:ankyrin repeat protein